MPLSPDASLFVPYEVYVIPHTEPAKWVAVQVVDEELIYISPIEWPTQAEAERHAHDLNYLRERAIDRLPISNLWVSIDIVADGPEALALLEKALKSEEHITGWRLLNPAADGDNDAWETTRNSVLNAIEAIAQEDLPFDDETSLEEHLLAQHGFTRESLDALGNQPATWFAKHHRELHDDVTAENLDHTHEWNNEEVEEDGDAEEEGPHEDPDS